MSKKKLVILWDEYKNTTVIKGSTTAFFFVFWFTKVVSYLAHRGGALECLAHSVVKLLPKAIFIIKNDNGSFLVEGYDDSLTICSNYFEVSLRPWLSVPSTRNIFIDIGANRGLYSVLACTKYKYSKVHAFEPNQDMVAVIKENLVLNKIEDRVTIHSIALGSEPAEINFTVDPLHKGGGRIESTTRSADIASIIRVDTLDASLDESTKRIISFIKIDTEGYELAVLKGMKQTLFLMPAGSALMIETTDLEALELILKPFNFSLSESKNNDHLFLKHA